MPAYLYPKHGQARALFTTEYPAGSDDGAMSRNLFCLLSNASFLCCTRVHLVASALVL